MDKSNKRIAIGCSSILIIIIVSFGALLYFMRIYYVEGYRNDEILKEGGFMKVVKSITNQDQNCNTKWLSWY